MLLLLSGQIATGKTAVATALASASGADVLRVREALAHVLGVVPDDRATLQVRGADLDRRTAGRWLRDYLQEHAGGKSVIDALRTRLQTEPILEAMPNSRLIFLEASETTRRHRYAQAAALDPVKASTDFDLAMRHPTESEASTLRAMAHVVIDTDDLSVDEIVREVRRALDLNSPD